MRYIFAQPSALRFTWELEVCIHRLYKLGVDKQDIVILLTDASPDYAERLKLLGGEVHRYVDKRDDKSYIPSIKPYLWHRYLAEDKSREQADYFYLDSDVLLTAIPQVKPQNGTWYASDCNSYIGNAYIDSKGDNLLRDMAAELGISETLIRSYEKGAGAQWVISRPTADYWLKVYQDSNKLHKFLTKVEGRYKQKNAGDNVPIQKWTAEMWAQLWNAYAIGIDVQIHSELDFVFATSPKSEVGKVKIIHNAGVTSEKKATMFYKADYFTKEPFKEDFSHIDRNTASWVYVQGIKEVSAMAKYIVIAGFRDKTDQVPYYVGEGFPKVAGKTVTAKRYADLVKRGHIEAVEEAEEADTVEAVEVVEEVKEPETDEAVVTED